MNSHVYKTAQFMRKGGQHIPTRPELPENSTFDLRMELLREEFYETDEAFNDRDLEGVADGFADLLVVALGGLIETVGDRAAEDVLCEVMDANLRKVADTPGQNGDGKITKPEGWEPPPVGSIIAEYQQVDIEDFHMVYDKTGNGFCWLVENGYGSISKYTPEGAFTYSDSQNVHRGETEAEFVERVRKDLLGNAALPEGPASALDELLGYVKKVYGEPPVDYILEIDIPNGDWVGLERTGDNFWALHLKNAGLPVCVAEGTSEDMVKVLALVVSLWEGDPYATYSVTALRIVEELIRREMGAPF